MSEPKKSVMIRINNQTKNLLNEAMKQNSNKFRSYAELLDFLLQEKSTSKAQKLVDTFLLKEKKCTDLASQVYLSGFRTDVMGGRLIVGNKEDTKFNYLIESELHLVEIKKNKDEIIQAVGQLLMYRQILQKNSWVDWLYLYLAIEEDDQIKESYKEFLRKLGIGLLVIKGAHIVLELEPKEQTFWLTNKIKEKSKFECPSCSSEYVLKELECRRCNQLLRFNIYEDVFKKTSIRLTNELKRVLMTDSVLKYVFKDVEKTVDELYKRIGSRTKVNREEIYGENFIKK